MRIIFAILLTQSKLVIISIYQLMEFGYQLIRIVPSNPLKGNSSSEDESDKLSV